MVIHVWTAHNTLGPKTGMNIVHMICVTQTRFRPLTDFAILASMVPFQTVQDTTAFNKQATTLVYPIKFTLVPDATIAQSVLSRTL